MLQRIVFAGATCACLIGQAVTTSAASLDVQLFPFTGEVRLRNPGVAPVQFISYSITSPSGKLNGSNGVWRSIADSYDASGSGFIDPVEEWTEFTPSAGPNATNLAEGVFTGAGGTLLGQRSLSLGRIWNASGFLSDLSFDIREPNEQLINVIPHLAIDGDYFSDSSVNATDYAHWRQYFGSTSILFADGNLDGRVNAADYVIWRKNVGKTIPGSASGSSMALLGAAGVVPEPSALMLLIAAGTVLVLPRRRR